MIDGDISLRKATIDDRGAVDALCTDIWPEHGPDYLPRVYADWIEGDDKHTLLAERDGTCLGIAQCVKLTENEAWCQGLRVHPDWRGNGVAKQLLHRLFEWARTNGATVARSMVYSWNAAGMGIAQAAGFRPVTSFRWAYPAVSANGSQPRFDGFGDISWEVWSSSEAATWLNNLGLSTKESWALVEYTPERIRELGTDDRTYAIVEDDTRAVTIRGREYSETIDDSSVLGQEYVFATWSSPDAMQELFDAISADAHATGAERARVLLPELPSYVAAVASNRTAIDDAPHYIFGADLTTDLS